MRMIFNINNVVLATGAHISGFELVHLKTQCFQQLMCVLSSGIA